MLTKLTFWVNLHINGLRFLMSNIERTYLLLTEKVLAVLSHITVFETGCERELSYCDKFSKF